MTNTEKQKLKDFKEIAGWLTVLLLLSSFLWYVSNTKEEIPEVKLGYITTVVAKQELCYRAGYLKESGKPWMERLSKANQKRLDGSVENLALAYQVIDKVVSKGVQELTETSNRAGMDVECIATNEQYKRLDEYLEL